jgi:MFS family permease
VLDVTLFRHRSFAVANLGSFGFGTGFFAVFFGYVLFLTDVWDRSARAAGLLMTPLAVCGAFLSPLAGRWVRRRGPHVPMATGGLLFASGAAILLVAAGDEPQILAVWLPAIVTTGAGAALMWPCLFASVVADVPRDRYSLATGINQTVQRSSTAFGVALAVTVLGAGVATFRWLFAICVASGLATVAVAPLLRPRARVR